MTNKIVLVRFSIYKSDKFRRKIMLTNCLCLNVSNPNCKTKKSSCIEVKCYILKNYLNADKCLIFVLKTHLHPLKFYYEKRHYKLEKKSARLS